MSKIGLMAKNLLLRGYLSREKRRTECLTAEVERLTEQSQKKTELIRKLQETELVNFRIQDKLKKENIDLKNHIDNYASEIS